MTEHTPHSYYWKTDPSEFHSADLFAISQDYSLTFSPTGLVALLCKADQGGSEYIEPEPVLRWGTEGEPLILWENQLVDARQVTDFRGLRRGRRVAGVLPGGGWTVESEDLRTSDDDESETGVTDVIAWIVTDMGTAVPIIHAPTSDAPFHSIVADEVSSYGAKALLLPPAERKSDGPEE